MNSKLLVNVSETFDNCISRAKVKPFKHIYARLRLGKGWFLHAVISISSSYHLCDVAQSVSPASVLVSKLAVIFVAQHVLYDNNGIMHILCMTCIYTV